MASKRELELTDLLGRLDGYISEARQRIDGQARGRRYRELQIDATNLANHAKRALDTQRELDKLHEQAARQSARP